MADAMFLDPATGDYRVHRDSPAHGLGFRNFPMDQFGVTDPTLRAIARTPALPAAKSTSAPRPAAVRDERVRDLMGAKVRNVAGLGERSAAGLSGEIGVLVVQVPPHSQAASAGLKEGDVILKCRDKDTNSVDELRRALTSPTQQQRHQLEIWRNQRRVTVELSAGARLR